MPLHTVHTLATTLGQNNDGSAAVLNPTHGESNGANGGNAADSNLTNSDRN